MHRNPGRKSLQRPIPILSTTISGTPQGVVLGFPLTSKKDACLSPTPARAATCLCRGDLSPMTLRCLESSGNGAEGAQSQWGTAGSAEEPSPEAARLAKALRELSHTGRERTRRDACEKGAPPRTRGWGCAGEAGIPAAGQAARGEDAARLWILGNAKGEWFLRDSKA